MRKVILIGKSGSGKTTLCQRLHHRAIQYKKTQSVEIYPSAIDTPGEYLENRAFYSALISTAADAAGVLLICDPTSTESFLPPTFGSTFAIPVIGIVTKVDLVDGKEIEQAKYSLISAGASQVFCIDSLSDYGIEELFSFIADALLSHKVKE